MTGLAEHEVDLLARLPGGLVILRIAEVAAIDRALLKCAKLPRGSAMRLANEKRLRAKRQRLFKRIEREAAAAGCRRR